MEQLEAEAGAVLSIAADVAEGHIDPVTAIGGSNEESGESAGPPSAAGLVARTFAALRTRVRDELKTASDEIQAADAVTVGIAQRMPAAARKKIAEARTSPSRSIVGLHRMARSWLPVEKNPDRDG